MPSKVTESTPAALWVNVKPRHIQDREDVLEIVAVLSMLDESCFSTFKDIWESLDRLFSHKHNEHLRMKAIADTKFWPLLLDGLKA